jgi:hypothetical protein
MAEVGEIYFIYFSILILKISSPIILKFPFYLHGFFVL